VDGIIIYPSSTLSHDMYVDRLQLTNAMTTEYNALQGGSVGQIAAQYTFRRGVKKGTEPFSTASIFSQYSRG